VGQALSGAPKIAVSIDIVSDVVCPWCYLGKARLEAALAGLPDIEAEIHWRPYQLDPSIPRTGVDRKAYMEAKFGAGPRLGEIHDQLNGFGKAAGITFDFNAIEVAPNTINAHRLIRWAAQAGPGKQNNVVDLLFKAFFEEGQDIGSPPVLIGIAKKAGMDASIVETLLPTDAEEAGVIGEIATSKQMGITGVPCFIIDQKYAVSGAQTPDILIDAIKNAVAARANPPSAPAAS
jgi:predicted DsbA family dithiol-disulfide isomerase